jgi:hypothetical protein
MMHFRPLDRTGFEGRTAWCGPSLVAMIAGIPLKQAHEKLCMMTGTRNKDDLGVWDEEVLLLLAEMGYRFRKLPDWNGTLRAYVRQQPVMERASMIIASVPGHVLGLHYGMVFDSITPKGVAIDRCQFWRRPIQHLYLITNHGDRK